MGIGLEDNNTLSKPLQKTVAPKTLDEVAQYKKISCELLVDGSYYNQKNLEHIFFLGPHSNRKLGNEQKCRGTHFCVPKGGPGGFPL